ncbi:MAG: ATP-binding protein [Desulfonatronovibrionaceae bacterium]
MPDFSKLGRLFFKPSTRAFWQEAKKENQPFAERVHAYVYGRWPYFYISLATGRHYLARFLKPFFDWIGKRLSLWEDSFTEKKDSAKKSFADSYHGKVVPLSGAEQLIRLDRDLEVRDLERVIPYTTARDIVLKNPGAIAALRCPCRFARKEPCLPMDVCLIIGEPFAGFIVEHHPDRARWITREKALDILRSEDRRGHVHHAFFKEAMLGRFYAICNCCSCCCGAMQARKNGVPMLASSGYVCLADTDKCNGCGLCGQNCQFGAIELINAQVHVDRDSCMGCGVCVNNCPQGALRLERDREKGTPLEAAKLMDAQLAALAGKND